MAVEDDEDMAKLLRLLLEREGFEVEWAPDGKSVLEAIARRAPPSIVLLDIMLPYVDGFQVLQHIRRSERWRDVPVVMLTTDDTDRDRTRALSAGANDYVTKPFRPRELLERITHLLAAHAGGGNGERAPGEAVGKVVRET